MLMLADGQSTSSRWAPYNSAPEALADAARLRLGTHFRITSYGGQMVLEDSLPALGEVVAA